MELLNLNDNIEIQPDKLYYKIGEASKFLNLKPSVLRFWEDEFKIKTHKSKSNQRLYEKKDIIKFFKLKKLLYEERYTLEGAKRKLKEDKNSENNIISPENNLTELKNLLIKIKGELEVLKE